MLLGGIDLQGLVKLAHESAAKVDRIIYLLTEIRDLLLQDVTGGRF